jgi:cation:H+ antiporter
MSTAQSEQATEEAGRHPRRQLLTIAVAIAATIPGLLQGLALWLQLPHPDLAPPMEALVFGLAVVGAAFLLAWAAEVAQLDVSAGLAIAVLALIAVLPEYAVSFVFAWEGGRNGCAIEDGENPCSLVLANMTGANRLLIGVGWAMVVIIAWFRFRRAGRPRNDVPLPRSSAVEVGFLGLATLYSLTLPFKDTITPFDLVVLVSIFIAYTIRISRAPAEQPHLIGPAAYVGSLTKRGRRLTYLGFFIYAAIVILLSAEHFAQGLVHTGEQIGISSFILVQWLAPLASEAPELLVAGLYAWRLTTTNALGTLLSSKVNQWTLLVGTLPLVFSIASGSLTGLPVDSLQSKELLLTASQSLFAVAILTNLDINIHEALALLGLFAAQFVLGAVFQSDVELVVVSAAYLLVGFWLLVRHRRLLPGLVKDAFRTPYEHLESGTEVDAVTEAEAALRAK